jgi:GxxExxY protein
MDDNTITEKIIGCAIEVHKVLGPGLLESIYEEALCHELSLQNTSYRKQLPLPVNYKGKILGEYRIDLLVEDQVVVELKAVDRMDKVFEAQLLTYLRITGKKTGLIINFNVPALREGIKRMVL